MCLGIPGRVIEILPAEQVLMAKVDFGGVQKNVCIEHVPHVKVGQYVIVHVGFALSCIDEAEARVMFDLLKELGELSELGPDAIESAP